MNIVSFSKSVRVAPRKVRLVADEIRSISVRLALEKLSLTQKRGASVLQKAIKSAVANGVNNKNISEDALFIKLIEITEGPAFKRFHPSTRGRVHPYKKRTSHIRIILTDDKDQRSKIKDQK